MRSFSIRQRMLPPTLVITILRHCTFFVCIGTRGVPDTSYPNPFAEYPESALAMTCFRPAV
jgi:hypothetical protein